MFTKALSARKNNNLPLSTVRHLPGGLFYQYAVWKNFYHAQTPQNEIKNMRYPTLALILCAAVHYASAAPTPHDEIQPDLNHNQIRKAEKQTLQEDNQVEQQRFSMSSEELLQQPEILTDAMDTALARQNIDNIRFLLPLYRRMTGHDETMASYAGAILSRADGKYKAAEQDLRNIDRKSVV